MPLEHSESVPEHEQFKATLEELMEQARETGDEAGARFTKQSLDFQDRHYKPMQDFGRFPWRNKWLGRESTEAERKWLEEGGDDFGTG